jgi:hypothetical protein
LFYLIALITVSAIDASTTIPIIINIMKNGANSWPFILINVVHNIAVIIRLYPYRSRYSQQH